MKWLASISDKIVPLSLCNIINQANLLLCIHMKSQNMLT